MREAVIRQNRILHPLPICAASAFLLAALSAYGTPTTSPREAGSPDAGSGLDGASAPESSLGIHGAYEGAADWFARQMGFGEDDFYRWTSGHLTTLGAHFTRVNTLLIWDAIEPVLGGGYNWEVRRTDRVLQRIHAPGNAIEALVGFDVGQQVNQRDPLTRPTEFQRFVRAVVERYDGDGVDDVAADRPVRVKYWQAGNEWPNWIARGKRTADYVQFVRLFAEAVHHADAEARVVLIGQMPRDPLSTWWERAVVDLAGVVDIVDLHDWNDAGHWRMTNLEAARAFLDGHGLASVAIWTGEDATHTGMARLMPYQTLEEQAGFLIKRICWARAHGLDKFFWSLIVDRHAFMGATDSFFNSIGLIGDGEYNNEPVPAGAARGFNARRPSYWAFKLLAEHTDTNVAASLGPLAWTNDSTRWGYAYQRRTDGRRAFVLWTAGGEQDLTVSVTGTGVRVVDLVKADEAGTPLDFRLVAARTGRVTLRVGDNPLLVLEE